MKVNMISDVLYTYVLAEKVKNKNLEILPCMFISDYETVNRNWKERLFSFPWNPFKATKVVQNPVAYITENLIIVSHETYNKIMKDKSNVWT